VDERGLDAAQGQDVFLLLFLPKKKALACFPAPGLRGGAWAVMWFPS
jgi:hypothetical protein